jgi:biopolymer transport protein ExbD
MSARVGDSGVNLGIIITPMLDMAFQLLAFFVMTYHPHAAEGHIDGKLLPAKPAINTTAPVPKDKDVAPTDDNPEDSTKDTLVVIVKAVPKGEIRGKLEEGDPTQIQLRRPESPATPENIVDVDSNAVTVKEGGVRELAGFESGLQKLRSELEKVAKAPGGGQTNINIEADPSLHHGYFVRVYDVCKTSGFKGVGFAPPVGGGR